MRQTAAAIILYCREHAESYAEGAAKGTQIIYERQITSTGVSVRYARRGAVAQVNRDAHRKVSARDRTARQKFSAIDRIDARREKTRL